MKEGAILGALAAFFVFMFLPIYGENGTPASLIPTANAVADPATFTHYIDNLPFSTLVFFSLEILGVSLGIAAQVILKKTNPLNQQ